MLEIGEVVEFLNLEVIFVVFFNVILNVLKEVEEKSMKNVYIIRVFFV